MSIKKDTTVLLNEIRAAGGDVVRGRRGHWKVYVGGAMIASVSVSASDHRGMRNARATLRRAGLKLA